MSAALGDLKSITAGTSPLQQQLGGQGRQMMRLTRAPRELALKQLTEAMRTGGVKAKIPMIQQAVSQSRQATSNAVSQTASELASRNVGGPFASRILASERLGGEQQTAAIPTTMAQSLISQFMPFMQNTQALGMSAFSTAAQSAQQLAEFNAAQRQSKGGLLGGGGLL